VPKTALIERNGSLEEVQAETLAVGDVIAIRPGDRVPADGVIVSGESAVDEAPVTGESTPKRKDEGETVFAGTINTDSTLRVRVSAEAQDNTIARVVRLVEEAQEAKAPTERFIDRFSRYYTPAVLVVGALVAILPPLLAGEPWDEWVYKGLAVLLIGCPCALVISTPAAIAAGLAAGARRGLLIKGGAVLETLGKVTTVALDKTGTLTEGRPKVTDVIALQGTEREVLEDAAALDATSSHPIAKAIVARAQAEGIEVAPAVGVMALGGKGVKGRFKRRGLFLGSPKAAAAIAPLSPEAEDRVSALQEKARPCPFSSSTTPSSALIAVRDEPRDDALEGLKALKARGSSRSCSPATTQDGGGHRPHTRAWNPGPTCCRRTSSGSSTSSRRRARSSPRSGTASTTPRRWRRPTSASPWAAARTSRWRRRTGPCCTGACSTSPAWCAVRGHHGQHPPERRVALGLKAVFLVTTIVGITGLWPAILADTGATVLVTANAMRLLGAGRSV
jgi:Cd2+/Zn2+-exporting ATPase